MGGPLPDLPEDLLARVPQLHTLAFTGNYTPYLGWLRHAGQLRTLTLDLRDPSAMTPALLPSTPKLQALTLDLDKGVFRAGIGGGGRSGGPLPAQRHLAINASGFQLLRVPFIAVTGIDQQLVGGMAVM